MLSQNQFLKKNVLKVTLASSSSDSLVLSESSFSPYLSFTKKNIPAAHWRVQYCAFRVWNAFNHIVFNYSMYSVRFAWLHGRFVFSQFLDRATFKSFSHFD